MGADAGKSEGSALPIPVDRRRLAGVGLTAGDLSEFDDEGITAAAGGAFLDRLLKIRMFPDGNASVARLLVQKLIPNVAPEVTGPTDIVGARFNYGALDDAGNSTRLRLNSAAVGIREDQAGTVEVDYVERGSAKRVMADHCILACYNGLIPHLCPEMPESQKAGWPTG